MIEQAIYSKTTTDLSAYIDTRCYLDILPKKLDGSFATDFPAIRFFRVDDPSVAITNDGGPTSLARPRFQFDIYAKTAIESKEIAEQLRISWDGFSGTVVGVIIQVAFKDSAGGTYEESPNLYHTRMDFIIWHTQEVV